VNVVFRSSLILDCVEISGWPWSNPSGVRITVGG